MVVAPLYGSFKAVRRVYPKRPIHKKYAAMQEDVETKTFQSYPNNCYAPSITFFSSLPDSAVVSGFGDSLTLSGRSAPLHICGNRMPGWKMVSSKQAMRTKVGSKTRKLGSSCMMWLPQPPAISAILEKKKNQSAFLCFSSFLLGFPQPNLTYRYMQRINIQA